MRDEVLEGLGLVVPHLAESPTLLAPVKILNSVAALMDSGAQLDAFEANVAVHALVEAAESEVLSKEEKAKLIELLKRLLTVLLSKYGYYKYGYKYGYGEPEEKAKESFSDSPLEINGVLQEAKAETEGLEWDVRVITSGLTVDGRDFYPPDTLRRAVEKFEGVQCFLDHPDDGVGSVTRLAGWLSSPRLVEEGEQVAIEATLHIFETSPASRLLREAYQRGAIHTLGLSINARGRVHFENNGDGRLVRVIDAIDVVDSVDIVTKPNAGGAILRLRASVMDAADEAGFTHIDTERLIRLLQGFSEQADAGEGSGADEVQETSPMVDVEDTHEPEVVQEETMVREEEMEAIAELKDAVAKLREELEAERRQRQIEAVLQEAGLPAALEKTVRARLQGVQSLEEATVVIQEAKEAWAVAVEAAKADQPVLRQVEGPQRKLFRLQALLAGERINDTEPYSSLREAFADITGKSEAFKWSGSDLASNLIRASFGFDSARITEAIETSDWAYMLGQAIHREMIRQYRMPGYDEWRQVCSSIGTLPDMRTQDRLRFSYFNLLPEVGEAGTYQPVADPSEQRAYFTPTKRGALVSWTWEAALNDDLNALREIPRRLALSAKLTVWYNIFNIFASASPPVCTYDNQPLFDSSAHNNLGTSQLTSASFGAARAAMMQQTAFGSNYAYLGIGPRFLLVPPELEGVARQLRNSEYLLEPSGGGATPVVNPWREMFDIIVIPFWSDNDAWALVADPRLIPTIEVAFLNGRDEPELFTEAPNSGSSFTADRVTYKIRHVWGYCILDHRGMYKSVPS